MARARVERAAADAALSVEAVPPASLAPRLRGGGVDLVIVDLDAGGLALVDQIASAATVEGVRVLGFFSHVDPELGDAARRAGCVVLPRGRFWRELPELLRSR